MQQRIIENEHKSSSRHQPMSKPVLKLSTIGDLAMLFVLLGKLTCAGEHLFFPRDYAGKQHRIVVFGSMKLTPTRSFVAI